MKREAGFTLVELLVSLAVTSVLILGVLATFDFSARMNRVQLNVADMQQSLRIAQNEVVRLARMTGRGSLPAAVAVQVVNNVPASTKLIASDTSTEIAEGTDILRLRGVFGSSLYQIDWQDPTVWTPPNASGEGTVVVRPTAAGVPQDLDALLRALKAPENDDETLLLVTPFDVHYVAAVNKDDVRMDGLNLEIDFKGHPNDAALNGTLPAGLPAVAYIGILEEHVFYVRRTGAGNAPSLTRARLLPGSNEPYDEDEENVRLDLADNVYDMQIALGFGVAGAPDLRLTTLVRTDRADAGNYQAPAMPLTIEDHAYPTTHLFNTAAQRKYRWRTMTTSVNLRNL